MVNLVFQKAAPLLFFYYLFLFFPTLSTGEGGQLRNVPRRRVLWHSLRLPQRDALWAEHIQQMQIRLPDHSNPGPRHAKGSCLHFYDLNNFTLISKVIGRGKTLSKGDIELVKKLYNCEEQRDRKTLESKQSDDGGFNKPSESEASSESTELTESKTVPQTFQLITQQIPSSSNMFAKKWLPKKRPNEVDQTRHVVRPPTKPMGPYRPYMPCRFYVPYHPFMPCIPYRSYRTFRNNKKRRTNVKPTKGAQPSGYRKTKRS